MLRLDYFVADGVAGEFPDRVEIEFAHDARAVGFHGFRAYFQSGGALFVGPALCQELDDLALPGGEAAARGLLCCARPCPFEEAFQPHWRDLGGKEQPSS